MNARRLGLFSSTWLAIVCFALSVASGQCLDWKPGFGLPGGGVSGGPGTGVFAQAVFDDGTGPVLYVAGLFEQAGALPANSIAKWNGTSWSSLGSGLTGVGGAGRAMVVFDDGTGPALYVGGSFGEAGGMSGTSFLARWNGANWSSVGGGVFGFVNALAVFDDGSGPALYVGGEMSQAGGSVPVHRIAKWNGATWSDIGGNTSLPVLALTTCNVGGGTKLFASGYYGIGSGSALFVAQWDGSSWLPLGSGIDHYAFALCAFDDGSGEALYVGGPIGHAGGVPVNSIAKWNGSTWSGLGSGPTQLTCGEAVQTFAVFDDGTGSALYIGGGFTLVGGQSANHVARWNGSSWFGLADGTGGCVQSLVAFDAGDGARLYAGGQFGVAGGHPCDNIASWGNNTWKSFDTAPHQGIVGTVNALAVFDDGGGSALYAGGLFSAAGPTPANNIAKWNGSTWSTLGSGVSNTVRALLVFDDGSGPALYVAGDFLFAGGQSVARIAKWNGSTWTPIGGLADSVYSLGVFDSGGGPQLYAGGDFTYAGTTSVGHIARWDGSNWSTVGGGTPDRIESMAVFDDGTGPALYVGGQFSVIGGIPALHVARWNGLSWSSVGGGLGYIASSEDVDAMMVFDDGTGASLVAVGAFAFANGVPAHSAARWNGAIWSPMGVLYGASALAVFDDGSGLALHAAGGSPSGTGPVRWDGAQWVGIGGGVDGGGSRLSALASFDDGTSGGPDLYIAGDFLRAGGLSSASIAEWRGCAGPGTMYCFGDTNTCPCNNRGTLEHGCDNSATTGGALLASAGHTHPDTVVLAVTHELPSALSIFLQGNATIAPVPFGDGLRCAGGSLKRLYVKHASGGVVFVPQPGDPSITTRSAELGDTIVPGSLRYYQTYYRDPSMTFCPAPTGNTWNVTNGVRIQW